MTCEGAGGGGLLLGGEQGGGGGVEEEEGWACVADGPADRHGGGRCVPSKV